MIYDLEKDRAVIEGVCNCAWRQDVFDWLEEGTGLLALENAKDRYEFRLPICRSNEVSLPKRTAVKVTREDFYRQLPVDGAEDEHLFDILGYYVAEADVIGATVAVCWGKIFAHALPRQRFDPIKLAKVVAIHEIAHLASHQGGFDNDDTWTSFSTASTAIKEIVAQMATEQVIGARYPELKETFETLLQGQSACYTAHREIKRRFEARNPVKWHDCFFWSGFSEHRNKMKSTTVQEAIDESVQWSSAAYEVAENS